MSLAVGAAVLAIDAAAVKAASDIETPIMNVATVWDEAGQKLNGTFLSLADVTQQLIGLSTELPQSAAQLAEGLYNVASSGFQGTEALTVLDAAARAASAGLTTTDTSARAITAVLNSYGLSASKAGDVSDTMFQIVNRGVITFEELAQNMGDIAPLASAAGVSFDDAGSALAAITLAGLPATEAATSLSGILRGLVDPSQEMTAQLHELGYESGTMALQALGLGGVLDKLRIATNGQSDAWIQLFPDIRAARGAMAATANDGKNLADVTAAITDSAARAGATQEALGKQSQSLSYQMQILHNTITAVAANFGQALLPIAKTLIGVATNLSGAIALLPAPFFKAASLATTLAGVLITLGGLFLAHWIKAKIFSVAIDLITAAMARAGASTKLLTTALNVMQVAQASIYGIAAAVGLLSMALGQAKTRANELVADINKNVDTDTYQGVVDQVHLFQTALDNANGANEKYSKGVDGVVRSFVGMIYQGLTPAKNEIADLHEEIKGYVGSLDEAKARQVQFDENVNQFANTTHRTRDEVIALAKANNIDLFGAYGKTQDALKAAVDAMSPAGLAAKKLKEDFDAVAKSIMKAFDPLEAHKQALEEDTAALNTATQAAKRAADERDRIESLALDHRLDTERAAWDLSQTLLERALEERQQTEDRAEDTRYKAAKDAEDARYQLAKEEFDRQARTEKEALDGQQRTEKEALDDRLALLDEEYDKRKKASERLYDTQKDEIQFQIDTTFGAEREGWKKKLLDLEDSHDAELAALDRQKDTEKRTQKDALDDSQQIAKDQLADDLTTRGDALSTDHDVRQLAIDDEHKQIQDGIDKRHQLEKDGYDEDARLRKVAFDDQQAAERQHLADVQKIRDDAADAARQKAAADHVESLGALNTQLQQKATEYDGHTKDVAAIMARGGSDILAEVEKWPPKLVHALAVAGPDMFNQVADGIRTTAQTVDPAKIGDPFRTLFDQASKYAAPSVVNGLAIELASGKIDATGLQQAIAKLMVTQVTGWQPLPPGIAGPPTPLTVTWTFPGGGAAGPPAPIKNADGGIMRFADGGEYHEAQIAPPGSWRLWAEPETGGEAYIPLARSKRSRSTSVLGQVAEQFGYGLVQMASGGILAGSRAGGSNWELNMPITIEARVSAGVDPDAVGRAIAVHAKRAVDVALDEVKTQITMRQGGR